MIWTAIVHEINGDELTVEMRADGEPDIFGEISISRFGLQQAQVGSLLQLDTDAQTVSLVEMGVWTQAELDDVKKRAKELHKRLMRLTD